MCDAKNKGFRCRPVNAYINEQNKLNWGMTIRVRHAGLSYLKVNFLWLLPGQKDWCVKQKSERQFCRWKSLIREVLGEWPDWFELIRCLKYPLFTTMVSRETSQNALNQIKGFNCRLCWIPVTSAGIHGYSGHRSHKMDTGSTFEKQCSCLKV